MDLEQLPRDVPKKLNDKQYIALSSMEGPTNLRSVAPGTRRWLREHGLVKSATNQDDEWVVVRTQTGDLAVTAHQQWRADPRQWWVVRSDMWPDVQAFAGTQSAAIQQYKEKVYGEDRQHLNPRDAAAQLSSAKFSVMLGPMTTPMAAPWAKGVYLSS